MAETSSLAISSKETPGVLLVVIRSFQGLSFTWSILLRYYNCFWCGKKLFRYKKQDIAAYTE
jgi:hypothetical protein